MKVPVGKVLWFYCSGEGQHDECVARAEDVLEEGGDTPILSGFATFDT